MKKLTGIILSLVAINLLTFGQSATRAVHVSLDPKQISIYDSLFKVNDWRKNFRAKAYLDSLYGKKWMNNMLGYSSEFGR